MNDAETLIALVAAAIVLVRIADLVSIPYPIVLVLGGLGIGFIPGGPSLELDPDVVFLVFLPPICSRPAYRRRRRQLIEVERGTLLKLRNEGRLKQDIFRRIQGDLDLDEARLRT